MNSLENITFEFRLDYHCQHLREWREGAPTTVARLSAQSPIPYRSSHARRGCAFPSCFVTAILGVFRESHRSVGAETLRTIAADPRHLGARIGVTLVLHTWGSALTHHPHIHGIVPGGGLSPDGERWIACKPGFFLPVRVLSRLFRRRFLEELAKAHRAGQLQFFGEYAALTDSMAFAEWLAPLRKCEWVVYAKRPFAGPAAVLAYLSRYTHRVAISNRRLVAMDERGITFRWKDYRVKGRTRTKTMTLSPDEFMRRFLLHVLPGGFHRIRHFGLIANAGRKENLARVRALLHVTPDADAATHAGDALVGGSVGPTFVCPDCGAPMIIIETFGRGQPIRAPPPYRRAS